ncbi:two-component system sensor histidine kinase CreC, partial [Escherichia coli]|nr:two-component system sensor histidine kinase CreC [Escherichia coli]
STFIAFEPVDVTALVDDICEACTPAVDDGHRSLSCQAAPGMTVKGDRELLAQAIINLLDNAQAHTPVGTAITITAFSAGGKVCV